MNEATVYSPGPRERRMATRTRVARLARKLKGGKDMRRANPNWV